MTIHGKGDTRRNFIHAWDASSAIMTILEHTMKNNENQNKIYNIGSNNEYSVIDIAEMLLKDIKGHDEKIEDWIEFVEDRNFNDFRYSINSEKLKKLGWNESINFLDGIKETIEYYKVICMKKS
jgi:dTDP-D-glucose 4,6-dehydratase